MTEFQFARSLATATKRNLHVPLDAWQHQKEVLARELPVDDWRAVLLAGISAEGLNHIRDEVVIKEDEPMTKALDAGIKALEPYM